MSDVELVIKIPEEIYDDIKNHNGVAYVIEGHLYEVEWAIKKGTPLPKNHGRLIDADDIDNHIIGHVDTRSCPTIIEADKAESEGKE